MLVSVELLPSQSSRRKAFEEAEAKSAALLAEKTAAAQREREARELQLAAEREAQRRWGLSSCRCILSMHPEHGCGSHVKACLVR